MGWNDILVKIGVGACLGFGIIVLAKIGRKKNLQDQKAPHSTSAAKQDTTSTVHTRRNE